MVNIALSARLLICGPPYLTEGYYELEKGEWYQRQDTYRRHSEAINLWFHGLTIYRTGMSGSWDFAQIQQHELFPGNITARNVQSQLLGLALSSSKAALDLLLVGYYSAAFASIRHMAESSVQCLYLGQFPEHVGLWVEINRSSVKGTPPNLQTMIKQIKKRLGVGHRTRLEILNTVFKVMNKRAHPSGEGITQTLSDVDDQLIFGPTYRENLCRVGLEHGLVALSFLLEALPTVRSLPHQWHTERSEWSQRVTEWIQAEADRTSGPSDANGADQAAR